MIVCNVTVKIEKSVKDEWLQWMQAVHIPDVMSTGYFEDHRVARVLVDEDDGFTYSIQYRIESIEKLSEYQSKDAPRLQAEHSKRYEGKYVAFRTLLEEV